MRDRLLVPLLVVAALVPAPGASADAPSDGGEQKTVVKGAPPSLGGRWLVVGNLQLKQQQRTKNTVAFWDVQIVDGDPVLTERFLELPPDDRAAMERADAAGQPWTPSPEVLKTVAQQWDTLPRRDVGLQSVTHEIIAPDEFEAALREEPATKDALWVVRQRYRFDPSGTAAVAQENVWAGVAAVREGYRVNVVASTVAAAPFPIPLAFEGTGTLYRLDDPPAAGILERIAAFFRGCGRDGVTSPPTPAR